LPSTTLVQNSCAALATWGSAKPPGGAKAQHFTLQCMTAFNAWEEKKRRRRRKKKKKRRRKKKKKRRRRKKKTKQGSSRKPDVVHPLGISFIDAKQRRLFFA